MEEKFKLSYWTLSSALLMLLGIFIYEEEILSTREFFLCYLFLIIIFIMIGMAPLFAERKTDEQNVNKK